MQTQYLILRNSISKLLFDVVEANYSTQQLDYVCKALSFEEAKSLKELLDTETQSETEYA